jgi:superkiller protein 3
VHKPAHTASEVSGAFREGWGRPSFLKGGAGGGFLALLLTCTIFSAAAQPPSPTELLKRGDVQAAEAQLREVLTVEETATARDLLGVALSRQGRHREAEGEFLRALALDPDFAGARQHLARLYLVVGQIEKAGEQLRAAATLGPLDRELALQLGVLEMRAGNAPAAAAQFRSLMERFESVQAALYLARIHSLGRDPEGALAVLKTARGWAPNSEDVLRTLARAALDGGLPVEAILALEPLLRMHPSVPEYAYLMGIARLQVGDTDSAVTALRQARQAGPPRALPLIALGLALNRQKQYEEAREALLEGLRLEPENVEGLAGLAESLEGLLELEAAESYAVRALTRQPAHPTANLVLGTVRMKQSRYEEARDALLKAVEADPGSPKAHYQLSLAYARLQEPELSRKHVELYQQALDAFEQQLEALGPAGASAGE